MNTQTRNIDAEISEMESRKQKLLKLMEVQQEVIRLEAKKFDSSNEVVEMAVNFISDRYKISAELLRSNIRPASVSMPRQILFHLLRKTTPLTAITIASSTRRTHGAVLYGDQHIQDLRDTDKKFDAKISALVKDFENVLASEYPGPKNGNLADNRDSLAALNGGGR